MVCNKVWPRYVTSFSISIKISIKLTPFRHISGLSLWHGKNSGKRIRSPCLIKSNGRTAGMDSTNLYINY